MHVTNMERLSDVLELRKLECFPCVIKLCERYRDPEGEDVMALTFRDAWNSWKEHQKWLDDRLSELSIRQSQEEPREDLTVVAYLSTNSPDMMLSILAAANDSRITVALLNTRWTPLEVVSVLQSSQGRTILLCNQDELLQTAQIVKGMLHHSSVWIYTIPEFTDKYWSKIWWTSIPRKSKNTAITGSNSTIMQGNNHQIDTFLDYEIQKIASQPQIEAVLMFTSGTTSPKSKGVRLSHRSLLIQALTKLRSPCQFHRKTRMLLSTVPLFHVGGFTNSLAVWLAGGTWILTESKFAFDPTQVLDCITHVRYPINTLVVVPAMLYAILELIPNNKQYSTVECLLIGGQSASAEMIFKLRNVFPLASRILQTYACTEAASSLTFYDTTAMTKSDNISRNGGDCVGYPPPHVQLQLLDRLDSNKQVTQPYQLGKIATRGPHMMMGYWDRISMSTTIPPKKDDTSSTWFITNDYGYRDDQGLLYYCGRTSDVVRTGGETVLAYEVERTLIQHPQIIECAVFGLRDDKFGETVCAAIVTIPEHTLSLQDIREHCHNNLAGYKQPRRLFHVDTLPRNSSGKVLKHELIQKFQTKLQSRL
jgi:acyl-CoA synthetase (AMP-forming)/AMP-acid ligase II